MLDLATHAGGFLGMMNTAVAWGESKLRSDRVKAAVQRNAEAGRRTGGGSRPFGYKIVRHPAQARDRFDQIRAIRQQLNDCRIRWICAVARSTSAHIEEFVPGPYRKPTAK